MSTNVRDCPKCAEEVKINARFCKNCGHKFEDRDAVVAEMERSFENEDFGFDGNIEMDEMPMDNVVKPSPQPDPWFIEKKTSFSSQGNVIEEFVQSDLQPLDSIGLTNNKPSNVGSRSGMGFLTWLIIGSIVVALCVGYFFGSSPSPPSSSSSSSSSYSSSKKKKQTFRQCITNGESVYEKCVLKNSRGKLRLVCERQWLSHLSTCCRLYPDDARSSLQCRSL